MAEEDLRRLLNEVGGWDGFEVHAIRREDTLEPDVLGDPAPRLVIELRARPGVPKRCSRCGAIVTEIHDVTERRIRDLPIWDRDTWLVLPRARVRCPRCGPTVEAVDWLDKHQRMTRRLAEKIAGLAMVLPLQHVAQWFAVHWTTVKALHYRRSRRRWGRSLERACAGSASWPSTSSRFRRAIGTPR